MLSLILWPTGVLTPCSSLFQYSSNIIKRRRTLKIDRKVTFWESVVPKMDRKMFKDNFRVSSASFKKICEFNRQNTTTSPSIPLKKRVAIALYALGSSAEYRTIANLFRVGLSEVDEIVLKFCRNVCHTFASYISSYPPTPEEIQRTVEGFKKIGFPQCYGALDCCHIEIQPTTKEEAVDYYNNKGWCSIILLAACDHRSKFTYFNIGTAGRNNDSYVFEKSSLKRFHEVSDEFEKNSLCLSNINVPVLLIGDSAFGLSKNMMKPYRFKVDQPSIERNFNDRLRKCHKVIENAFGQLKARFTKIGSGLEVDPRNCVTIIKACCLLHNFLKEQEDDFNLSWTEEFKTTIQRMQPISIIKVGNNNAKGKAIRDAIALSLYNEVDIKDDVVESS